MKERLCIDKIRNLNRINYDSMDSAIRRIIVSKLSYLNDLNLYLDDLVANSFIVLLRSVNRFDSSKSQFQTYAYNRIVAASKKLYYSLKFPYSGIKALMGRSKKDQEGFFTSNLAYLMSVDELEFEISDEFTVEDITCS